MCAYKRILCIIVYVSVYFYYFSNDSFHSKYEIKRTKLILVFIFDRYIELCPSTYSEAKKTITNDAYLNGKRFSGENEDEGNKNNNHRRTNRSRNRRQSRSTSPRKSVFKVLIDYVLV